MIQNNIVKIGITGGMASGKSTFSRYLMELGYKVIDADKISKEVFKTKVVQDYLKTRFKDRILSNGSVDRKKIANIVFNDKCELESYEKIIIPLILNEIKKEFEKALEENPKDNLVFLDAPLLFEKAKDLVDITVTIEVDEEIQIKRAMKRDIISYDQVLERLKNQIDDNKRIMLSDYVIYNNGTIEELKLETDQLLKQIIRSYDG